MPQTQFVQKPYKVRAEQFNPAAVPDQPGVCRCTAYPPFADGRPHVHGRAAVYELHSTAPADWIVEDVWTPHAWSAMPDAEFLDRF